MAMYRYNGKKRRMKLGNHPRMALADARDEAKAVFGKAEKGQDPATEKRAQRKPGETVKDLSALYVEEYAKNKKRSWKKVEQILSREVIPLIGRKRIEDVSRQDVRDVLKPIVDRRAPIRANHTLEVIRKMFNWSRETRDFPLTNPAAGHPKPGESNSRSRYLRANEFSLDRRRAHSP